MALLTMSGKKKISIKLPPKLSNKEIQNNTPPSYIVMRYQTCECGETFYKESDLSTHFLETNHTIVTRDISTYQCNLCTKTLSNEAYFLLHHNMVHQISLSEKKRMWMAGFKEFKCHICSKVFSKKVGLKLHLSRHSGVKPYKCDQCDKAFLLKVQLEMHQNTHKGLRPFACKDCPMAFASRSNLNRHGLHHTHGKIYQCDTCSTSFVTQSYLKYHNEIVHLKTRVPKRKPRGTGRPRMTVTNYHKFDY